MRGALEGRGHPAAGVLPRGARRGPDPALLGDAPPPPARRPARDRQLDRRGASPARSGPRARRTSSSTRATCRCASCASGSSPASASCRTRTGWRSSSSASASSTACRSRRTSSSTSGSCRTRTTSTSCGQLSGLTETVREFVLGQPVAERFLAYLHEFLDLRRPGLRRRGQDPAHDRRSAARAATTARSPSPRSCAAWLREQDFGTVAVFHRELERA